MRRHVQTSHLRAAAVRPHQGGQDLHRGGLAGAVRPEHAEDGPLRNSKVEAVERLDILVVLHQPVGDHCVGHVKHPPTPLRQIRDDESRIGGDNVGPGLADRHEVARRDCPSGELLPTRLPRDPGQDARLPRAWVPTLASRASTCYSAVPWPSLNATNPVNVHGNQPSRGRTGSGVVGGERRVGDEHRREPVRPSHDSRPGCVCGASSALRTGEGGGLVQGPVLVR